MPLLIATSYDPINKTTTVAGDISTASLLSIVNQTRGKDLFVVGQTPVTNRVFSGGNTTFTLDTNTSGDNASDVLSVRYQSDSADYATAAQGTKADNSVQLTSEQTIKGIKTFTEKLILPNCVLVNGVADFRQATKPTQRTFLVNDAIVTEPLVVGDRWYNPINGNDFFWNGTYWLTSTFYYIGQNFNSVQTYNLTTGASFGGTYAAPFPVFGEYSNFFYESVTIVCHSPGFSATLDANNYFTLNVRTIVSASPIPFLVVNSPSLFPNSAATYPVNVATSYGNSAISTNLSVTNVVGTPALTARLTWSIKLRGIA